MSKKEIQSIYSEKIRLISKDSFGDSLIISLKNSEKRLSISIAEQIQVSQGANL